MPLMPLMPLVAKAAPLTTLRLADETRRRWAGSEKSSAGAPALRT